MPTTRDTPVSRRTFLHAGGLAAGGLAAGGLALGSAVPALAAPPAAHRAAILPSSGRLLPATPWFDLDTSAAALVTNAGLHHQRTIMQSFAFDSVSSRLYVVQVVQAGTTLPGDQPGDEEYAERARRGDLTLTALDLTGRAVGHMYLKGFGHGVSIGLERYRGTPYLWTEVDAVAEGANGWGTRLARFAFRDGAVLDAASSPEIDRRELLPGVDRTTASTDPVHRRLVMRYRRDGAFRYALFDLARIRTERRRYVPIADVAQPDVLAGTTFQGYTAYGSSLYLLDGTIYSDTNPPEGRGNTHLTRVDLRTGAVEQRVRTTAGHTLHRREPEGMAVLAATGSRAPRLCFGFGTSVSADPAEDRLCTILYHDVLRRGR